MLPPETRERILAAARELGYQPNSVAQSLRRRRTHTIGVVTDAIASSPFAGRLFAGATERAAEHGYVLIAHDTHGHPEREPEAIATLMRRQVDGLVYASMGFRHLSQAPVTPCPWSWPTAPPANTTS